jgi:predicted dehydrogenase
MIGLQRRYKPGYIEAIEKIHRGAVGNVRFIEAYFKWTWDLSADFWLTRLEMAGGQLVEHAVHHMDVISWIMKGQHPERAVSIGGVMRPNKHKSVVEDHSATCFEFANGTKFQYTNLFHVSTPAFCGELIRVYGQTAGAEIYKRDYFAAGHKWKAYDEQSKETILSNGATETSEGAVHELLAFADHCRKGPNQPLPASNIETARIATFMGMMGRMAMFNTKTWKWNERVIEWKDLGTTTDP